MPAYLQEFKFGWKALNGALNDVAVANNSNVPLEGAGIRIEQTKSGCLISRADMVAGATKGGGGPTDGQWIAIAVVDPDTCKQSKLLVWAKPTS